MTVTFAQLTTMRVGGPIGRLEITESTGHAVDLLRAHDERVPLLVIGGGSNLVVGDEGFDGTVIKMASKEVDLDGERVTASAGVDWDGLVELTVAEGLSGLEALSGIPGTVGGTPVQNVGAYGYLTGDVLEAVTVYDRQTGALERWGVERCGFGPHRQSVFKHTDRWAIIDVTYRLRRSDQSLPLTYEVLYQSLGVEKGGTAKPADVRDAVVQIRRGRGMVLDPADHDTWSVGSFFVNPVVPADTVPAKVYERGGPAYPDPEGTKLSAAWLIQSSGFSRGYGGEWGNGRVTLSSRHTLAITNRGGATATDVVRFAAHVADGVEAEYGLRLTPECDLVNCAF
ncbi:UDP-N-acetylmuramate dehydrogenase [Dactylosporangium sp. NPDC005572]|uniref:UDP-N-acetylmuramate dehydrogenase n=1 Tax=Dactylosporangium sp. NPDC005572 TaxID=3156889 RepID=UPI0033BC964D